MPAHLARTALVAFLVALFVLLVVALFALPACAATPLEADAPPATAPGLPTEAWIALVLAALGGIRGIVRGARELFAVIAPRTRNTVDDSIRDVLIRVDDTMREMIGVVRASGPRPAPSLTSELPTGPRGAQSGRVQVLVLPAIALVGVITALIVLGLTSGCAARQRTAAGVRAGLDCESRALTGTFAALLPVATDAVVSWISADGRSIDRTKLKAALSPLTDKDTHVACAITTALAAIATPAPTQPDAPAAAGLEVDAAAVRATFAEVRAELGWAPIATSAGVM